MLAEASLGPWERCFQGQMTTVLYVIVQSLWNTIDRSFLQHLVILISTSDMIIFSETIEEMLQKYQGDLDPWKLIE